MDGSSFLKRACILFGPAIALLLVPISTILAVCNVSPPPNNGTYNQHRCGTGGPSCADSALPVPNPSGSPSPLPAGTTYANLANPMAACCGMGWVENLNEGQKLDCVEAIPPPGPSPTPLSFEQFYSFGATADAVTTATLTYPNALFLLDRNTGQPLNGFYQQNGTRCAFSVPQTPTQQHQLYRDALFYGAVPTVAPIWTSKNGTWTGPTATVDKSCCFMLTFALERRCPATDTVGGGAATVALSYTQAGVTTRRCTAAASMKVHFGLFDLCNPVDVGRGRFRPSTSLPSADRSLNMFYPSDPLQLPNIIRAFYPVAKVSPSPIPTPTVSPTPKPSPCPTSPALFLIPWSDGYCDLRPGP